MGTTPDPAPPDPAPKGGNVKVTRADWLSLAAQMLIERGVSHVKVLTLANHLGVSRSSFYWYFRSREDLLDQLLERWEGQNTRAVLDQADRNRRSGPVAGQAAMRQVDARVPSEQNAAQAQTGEHRHIAQLRARALRRAVRVALTGARPGLVDGLAV